MYEAVILQCHPLVLQTVFPGHDRELQPLPCYMRQICIMSRATLPMYSHVKPSFPNPISKPMGLFHCTQLSMSLPPWYQQGEWCAMWNWKQSETIQLKWDFSGMWNNGTSVAGFSLLWGFLRMGMEGFGWVPQRKHLFSGNLSTNRNPKSKQSTSQGA